MPFDLATAMPVQSKGFDLSTATPVNTEPTRSWGDVPGEARGNLFPSAKQFAGGIVEAVKHPIDTTKSLFQLAGGAAQAMLPQAAQDWLISVAHDPEKLRQSIKMAQDVGGAYKQRYGTEEGFKNALATDPVGVAADFSTLLSGGTMVTSSVAPKVSSVLATAAKYTNPMTPIVAAAEFPLRGGAKVAENVFNALDPKAKAYLAAAENRGPEIVNALINAPEFVAGSAPTAAQAAAPAGATRFAALGRQSADKLSSDFLAREAAQKEAQLAAIRTVGKTPMDIAAADAARTSATAPLYKIADKALVESDAGLSALLQRPSMDKVLARAKNLAEEKGAAFQMGENIPAQTIPSTILDASGKPMGATIIPAEVARYPGTSLHYMKLAFDDLIHDPAAFGIGKNEAAAIDGTRKTFLKWFENKVPEYGAARELYSAGSKPINQMQVGQFLEGKLIPALGEETGKLRATGFATAVENAPATIKKAVVGAPRYDSLSKILAPEQMAVIDGIKNDLARIAETEYAAGKGMKSSPDLLKTGSEALSGLQAPNLLNRIVAVANEIIHRLKGGVNEKIAIEIATEMLDPKLAAAALKKAMDRKARGQKFIDPFKAPELNPEKTRNIGVAAAAQRNALAPESQNQNALAP